MKGRLLIATPTLLDPNFRRTVVLLLEHTPDGAIGVVLNRPSDTEAREAVPDLRAVLFDDEPIFLGGPVQPETVIALADHNETPGDEAICGSIASRELMPALCETPGIHFEGATNEHDAARNRMGHLACRRRSAGQG